MPLVKALSLAELPSGSVREVTIEGNAYALCNVDGEIHAMGGVCLHRGGPLGQGALHGATLVCPWHAWEYDCRTGANDFNPDIKLPKYAVAVQGDDVLIEVE
jgi:nitrite reductase/ring-hydroxylating ferredoxin subunit